jgi:Fur family transcriptional regulator, ferric uptake regulator
VERNTRQRGAIRRVFRSLHRPLSPAEVLDAAKAEVPAMGIATVYRTIKAMVDEGEIASIDVPGEAPRYEIAHLGHHHHFHCRACNKVFEVEGCPTDIQKLAPPGFVADGHEVMLFGRCVTCKAA